MRYGHFDDKARQYVIERPDTPAPWTNYLGDGEYCAIISNNAGGYSFFQSPGNRRVMRYRFNAVPQDRPGRYVYLRSADGDYWSNSWSPVQKPLSRQKVTCRHGLGYTIIDSRYRGLRSSALYFVPLDENLELWQVTLTNATRKEKTLDVFAFAEVGFPRFSLEYDLQFILYTARSQFADGIVDTLSDPYARERGHVWMTTDQPVESFDATRESFIGAWRDEGNPIAVEQGRCGNASPSGGNPCCALHVKVTLAPGQQKRLLFIYGTGVPEEAAVRARKLFTPEYVDREFARLGEHWQRRLAAMTCRTPDPALNSMANVWNAYQAHVNFRWSRSASFIEAGGRDGFGFRDTLQDVLSVMHTLADDARERIVDLLRGQASGGASLHKVQPLSLKTGQGEQPTPIYSDDHLWIPLAVAGYVRETGDTGFLDRRVEFLDSGAAGVMDHMSSALDFAWANRGPNALLLGLHADWNDCINLGSGESVFSSMLLCKALLDYAELATATGRDDAAEQARTRHAEMTGVIESKTWDGHWYMRAVRSDGDLVGSHANAEGQIFLNTQSWAVLGGIAAPERAMTAMDSVHERLASEHGVHLFAPPYTKKEWKVGGATFYPPGLKENGSIFCHPNPWAVIAETMLRRGDRAYEYYKAYLPSAMNDRAELRMIEPYVYGQFVRGQCDDAFGRAHNPWLTGTAAWSYTALTQYVLGIRPSIGGLVIDPCIPSAWRGFRATRQFRGATYQISVRNPSGVCCGVKTLSVDGKTLASNVVPPAPAGAVVKVQAVMV